MDIVEHYMKVVYKLFIQYNGYPPSINQKMQRDTKNTDKSLLIV